MRLVILLGLGLLVLGGVVLWVLGGDGRQANPAASEARSNVPTPSAAKELARDAGSDSRAGISSAAPDIESPHADLGLNAGAPRAPVQKDRFVGRGRIRGSVRMADNSQLPSAWTLTARPSKMLMGGEFAELRQLELSGAEPRFSLDDLPFGSYDILAQSSISNARGMQVVLDRDNPYPFLSLEMEPAGELDGRLLDSYGNPASAIPVVLQSLDSQERHRTLTDALGRFRFPTMIDGAYQLTVGEFENPIMAKSSPLRLQAPGMTLPDIELPKLASLDLHLINEAGENLSDVIVRGAGSHGGSVDAKTDIFGLLSLKHLPAGRYRLRFQLEGYQVKRSPIELKLDQDNAYAIELLLE